MGKVRTTIKNQRVLSVSFVWMQGERDAKMGWGKIYEKALIGLHNQLANDLKWNENDIGFVIGRLSDFDMDNKRYPHWTIIRDVQERVSNSKKNFLLVNTDDLNDGFNRKGKAIKDDLHYSAEGYKLLGHRFAKACIQIIKNRNEKASLSPDFITALSGKVKVASIFSTTWFFSNKVGIQFGWAEHRRSNSIYFLGF